jgi:TRAP-type C4-dicarboxylate transport system permease small subunit
MAVPVERHSCSPRSEGNIPLEEFAQFSPYWAGFLGSAVVEAYSFVKAVEAHDGRLPDRYRRLWYAITRILFPFLSGTIPWGLGATSFTIAFYMGASAPLIFDRLARGIIPPPDSPGR